MRKLAAELSVTPRSLYHYVPTKAALLREVYIGVLSELELSNPNQGHWCDNIKQVAYSFRALCHRHKNIAPYFLGGHEPVAQDTAIVEVLLNLLVQAGVLPVKVIPTSRALIVFLVGFILAELNAAPHQLEKMRTLARKAPEAYPTLLGLPERPDANKDKGFEVALELLIAGLEPTLNRP